MSASNLKNSPAATAAAKAALAKAMSEEDVEKLDKNDPWISIELARRRISRCLAPTPMMKGRPIPGSSVRTFFKCDQMRRTGAYKERGGLNALMSLTPEEAKKGVVAASAGNHAQALAYHGGKLGIPVTVVMPTNAPIVKVENCRGFGATIVQHGKDFAAAKDEAMRLCQEKGLKYINGYDHPQVIAGAGTCGLEILDQLPGVDVIIVPVGGGGLLAGISLAVKRLNPRVRVIGVESERCPDVTCALKAGKPIYTPVGAGGTIADGLAVNVVGSNALEIIRKYVDEVITVPESFIARGILHMLEVEKMLVEGGGATGLAAILSGRLEKQLQGKKVVTVVTGGNIDITLLGRIISQGLYSSGRLHKFDVAISNRVGGIAQFTGCLSKTGASVKYISQETLPVGDVYVTTLHMVVETTSTEHYERIVKEMGEKGFVLKTVGGDTFADVDLSKL
uniref:Serine racemase n=1 Tax=Herpetomonas muscarum TaxID=5718 RepID=U5KLL0_HERMU|nr:threonine ammonia-lyase [Herpetomonas muscarum]